MSFSKKFVIPRASLCSNQLLPLVVLHMLLLLILQSTVTVVYCQDQATTTKFVRSTYPVPRQRLRRRRLQQVDPVERGPLCDLCLERESFCKSTACMRFLRKQRDRRTLSVLVMELERLVDCVREGKNQ